MNADMEVVKTMIELSNTEDEADSIVEEFTGYKKTETESKLRFLFTHFPNVAILGGYDGDKADKIQTDYQAVLSAVINLKWR